MPCSVLAPQSFLLSFRFHLIFIRIKREQKLNQTAGNSKKKEPDAPEQGWKAAQGEQLSSDQFFPIEQDRAALHWGCFGRAKMQNLSLLISS